MTTSTLTDSHVSLEELELVIKQALKKTGLQKETDLCSYIPYEDSKLSSSVYLWLKDSDRQTLYRMINDSILAADPCKIEHESSKNLPYVGQSLEACIKMAMEKLNIQNENALCKYIPYGEGHIHHFTYLKTKSSNPVQIRNLIKENILDRTPKRIPPKPRRRRSKCYSSDIQSSHEQDTKHEHEDLDTVISQAMNRKDLALSQEEDLCRYLPKGDSFLHPLAYRSLKSKNPHKLAWMIKEYALRPSQPQLLKWQRSDQTFSDTLYPPQEKKNECIGDVEFKNDSKFDLILKQLDKLIRVSQEKTDRNKPEKISEAEFYSTCSSKSLTTDKCVQYIQNQLIIKILRKEIDQHLWDCFVEVINF